MFRQTCLQLLAVAPLFGLALATAARAEGDTTISGPHTHENLSLYFIHGKSAPGPVPLTLEEALAKGLVEVNETDQVNSLTIENKSREEVFIHAGDIVKGGRQDRVVTATLILPPKSGRINASVYCVESGRWAARGVEDSRKFASSAEMLPTKDAKIAMYAAAPTASGTSEQQLNREPPRGRPNSNDALGSLTEQSASRLQAETRAVGGQGEVWDKVAGIQKKLSEKLKARVNSAESETSLQLALENDKLKQAQDAYMSALQSAGENDGDIIGYAIAVNGKIASADVYASNALFRKLWPRLLKSAVTEAIGADAVFGITAPDKAEVDAFLVRAPDAHEQETTPLDGIKTATRDAPASFDAETRRADGGFLHRTKMKR